MHTDSNPQPLPAWWRPEHQSLWSRVKDAMERDWEQTKADFSGGKNGADLNQHVGDTVRQALGQEPIPTLEEPNPLTPKQTHDRVATATKDMANAAERIADEAADSVVARAPVTETGQNVVDYAEDTTSDRPGRGRSTPRDMPSRGRWETWANAEEPLRYGYVAAGHYSEPWTDALENRLRGEWTELHPQDEWIDVRDVVHRGWTHARA